MTPATGRSDPRRGGPGVVARPDEPAGGAATPRSGRERAGGPRLRAHRPTLRRLLAPILAGVTLAGCGGQGGPVEVRADGFAAVFAHPPHRSTERAVQDGRTVVTVTYVTATGGETDAVSTSPAPPDAGTDPAASLERAAEGSARALGGSLVRHRLVRWLGHAAESALIATTDSAVEEQVAVVAGRLYVVEGISTSTPPSFAGYRALLASFRFLPPAPG